MNYDALLDAIVGSAEIATGASPVVVSRRFNRAFIAPTRPSRPPAWTDAEMIFLRDNLTVLPVEEIAAHLGRTAVAVKIRQTRKMIPAKSRQPGYLTGNQIARVLGIDIHSVMKLAKRGILPIHITPGKRQIMIISKTRLYMWATNWKNWMYFRPWQMRDLYLRSLVELAQSRWGDEWLTIGQAAQYLGVTVAGVNQAIRRGHNAVGAVRWGNWWLRRSVVETMTIRAGKGSARSSSVTITARQAAFFLRAARDGLTCEEISRMSKWRDGRAVNHQLRRMGFKRSPQWMYRRQIS